MRKNSTLWAAVAAVIVFVMMFAALDGATDVIRLAGPAVLALLAAFGTRLALARTPAQITDDTYRDDSRELVDECLGLVEQIREAAREVGSPSLRAQVDRVAQVVPELLRRVERTSPTSLYSSASQLKEHLTSLRGVVATYADIEAHPAFYERADQQLVAGEQAVKRFVDFTLDNIRLVNQGDVATYQSHLATVAPPEMPKLEQQ